MSKLQQRKKTSLRWKSNDGVIELYKITPELESKLIDIISKKSNVDIEKGESNAEYGESIIRMIIRESTNIGAEIDEYSEEEIFEKFEIEDLLEEIQMVLEELTDKVIKNQISQLREINRMLKAIEHNEAGKDTIDKLNKMLKKQGTNLNVDDFVLNKDNPDKLAELIKESKKKNNKKKGKK